MESKGSLPITENSEYEELWYRGQWIYENIRAKYFDQYVRIDEISFTPGYDVLIYTSQYYSCYNTTDEDLISFPYNYLFLDNDKLNELFKEEAEKEKQEFERIQNARIEKERAEREIWERKQLLELLTKYGIPNEYKEKQNG